MNDRTKEIYLKKTEDINNHESNTEIKKPERRVYITKARKNERNK